MKRDEVRVVFQPSGRSVFVLPGTSVLEAAGRAGIILQTPCGGQGTCGKCRVRIVEGEVSDRDENGTSLPADLQAQGFWLACHTLIRGNVTIDIPNESLFESRQKILTEDSGERGDLKPVVRKRYFDLAPPSSDDAVSDMARLQRDIGHVTVARACMAELSRFLRAEQFRGTAVLIHDRLTALESGDTSGDAYGLAVDLGTTTVVGTLFNLADGREMGITSRMNAQIPHGDDVVSRILKVRENAGALDELQSCAAGTVNEIIEELTQAAGITPQGLYEIVLAGNSTMQQIFCGYDPSALGEVPFTPVFDEAQTVTASKLGLKTNPGAEVFVFPQVGGFVGGDTVAGMTAARLDRWDKAVVFVDIGTNGEIVLAAGGKMQATSTAAGPAFEGARIRQGMRATAGAIEKVLLRDHVLLNVIGNSDPAGLCGTAVIDTVAELLRQGLVDETGRILEADECPSEVSDGLRARVRTDGDEPRFVLVSPDEHAAGKEICLWQKDVRELQLATGAIRAGINILMRRAGLELDDIGAILLAGAFGNFIRRSNARRIGLLPPAPCDNIRYIGNAASMGAKLALLSEDERDYAETLRKNTEHVDLSLDPEFQEEFGMAMIFPGDEVDLPGASC